MVHLKISPWKRRFRTCNPSFSGEPAVKLRGRLCVRCSMGRCGERHPQTTCSMRSEPSCSAYTLRKNPFRVDGELPFQRLRMHPVHQHTCLHFALSTATRGKASRERVVDQRPTPRKFHGVRWQVRSDAQERCISPTAMSTANCSAQDFPQKIGLNFVWVK